MPNVGSWNGKWSGENDLYAIVHTFRTKEGNQIATKILEKKYYHYNFGDGWSAGIRINQIDSKQKRYIQKKSRGFYGYEWMIDSIIKHNKIIVEEI
jgi:hypothetical protein